MNTCKTDKVCVFTTSAIQEYRNGALVSTRRLERALAAGYTCYVVSSRHTLSDTDNWWRALVPSTHIFLTDKEEYVEDGGYANSPSTINPWRRLYACLGIYPVTEWSNWMCAQEELKLHGIRYSYIEG